MKIRVLSDLHLEFSDWHPPPVPADVIVLAGDIHNGAAGLHWARRHFAATPIVYVPGNHEFYDRELHSTYAELRAAAADAGVHLLSRDEVTIGGVRFLGATLWTDFALYGGEPNAVACAMRTAERLVVDYRVIRHANDRWLCPGDTLELHRAELHWLELRLSEPVADPTVVITHHLPHARSVHPKYEGDRLNPAFASNLAHLVREPVALWIHGHTHESLDYEHAGTRVVCNPRGYVPHEPNRAFEPGLVIEVPSRRRADRPKA